MSERVNIDVVIPVYGAGPYLENAVAALRNQSPAIGRIVISHSGDGDPTARFAGMPDMIVLHSPERLFAGAARNRGLAHVRSGWVAFIDEDIIVGANWHSALQSAIARGDCDCIVGSIGCAASGGYWGMSLWFSEFGSVHPYLAARACAGGPSANLILRRDALVAADGFPEDWSSAEELVLQGRLKNLGYAIRFEPDVRAGHMNLPGFQRMLRHSLPRGRGSAMVREVCPELAGSLAVRWPGLSLGLWVARMGQIYWRVLASRGGPRVSLLLHTPGILIAVLAWNAGFAGEAFRHKAVS